MSEFWFFTLWYASGAVFSAICLYRQNRRGEEDICVGHIFLWPVVSLIGLLYVPFFLIFLFQIHRDKVLIKARHKDVK